MKKLSYYLHKNYLLAKISIYNALLLSSINVYEVKASNFFDQVDEFRSVLKNDNKNEDTCEIFFLQNDEFFSFKRNKIEQPINTPQKFNNSNDIKEISNSDLEKNITQKKNLNNEEKKRKSPSAKKKSSHQTKEKTHKKLKLKKNSNLNDNTLQTNMILDKKKTTELKKNGNQGKKKRQKRLEIFQEICTEMEINKQSEILVNRSILFDKFNENETSIIENLKFNSLSNFHSFISFLDTKDPMNIRFKEKSDTRISKDNQNKKNNRLKILKETIKDNNGEIPIDLDLFNSKLEQGEQFNAKSSLVSFLVDNKIKNQKVFNGDNRARISTNRKKELNDNRKNIIQEIINKKGYKSQDEIKKAENDIFNEFVKRNENLFTDHPQRSFSNFFKKFNFENPERIFIENENDKKRRIRIQAIQSFADKNSDKFKVRNDYKSKVKEINDEFNKDNNKYKFNTKSDRNFQDFIKSLDFTDIKSIKWMED